MKCLPRLSLPCATDLPIGYIEERAVQNAPCEVFNYGEDRVHVINEPGIYNFWLIDNRSENGIWSMISPDKINDNVNHPKHYTSSKATCGNCKESIECIDVTRHMSFNIGNAVKYLWRHELKGGVEDLKKAKWYINDAIKQLEGKSNGDV